MMPPAHEPIAGQHGAAADPGFQDLDALPGVAEAVERARSAIASIRRLPANRQGWARTAAAAGIRAARASAMLEGGSVVLDAEGQPAGIVTDPVLAGSLRANAAVGELVGTWRRAPLQALARLHVLAAIDLVPGEDAPVHLASGLESADTGPGGGLGRPRPAAAVGARLVALAGLVTRAPWSGPVLVAIVHGELLALRPFGSADGVVARAAARLTMVSTGLDPQALTVPEVGHLRAGAQYREAAAGYASGEHDGIADWIGHVCRALESGAREARSIATAAGTDTVDPAGT